MRSTKWELTRAHLWAQLREQQMHKSWVDYKLKDGWTFGPEPDSLLKQHPCLVDYEDLPSRERIKDTFFLKTVRLFLLGLRSEFGEFED